MSEIHTILQIIQANLKAPKGQTNNFGRYKYRSCEDVLEALKPHLKEANATLTLSDYLVMIGDRFYINAQATLFYKEENIVANGWAREEAIKKGMDSSQITGASSSYARKYALNGLFLIDDNKDSDSTNKHDKTQREKLKGVADELNQEAYNQIERKKTAISKYSILLKMKNPANQNEMLKTFKTKNIDEMMKLYKQLQES